MLMEAMEVQLHVFSTTAVDGGERSAYSTGRFTSGEIASLSVEEEARWAPELVWRFREKNFLVLRELKYDSG